MIKFTNIKELLADFREIRKDVNAKYTRFGAIIIISLLMYFVVTIFVLCTAMDLLNAIFKKP